MVDIYICTLNNWFVVLKVKIIKKFQNLSTRPNTAQL